jgi:DNA-binding NarL/FixJ family response regulator
MAKRSKSKRPQEASAPAAKATARIAPRRKTADRRLRILERLTNGLSVAHIARAEPLAAPRVRQIIAEMLANRGIDRPPALFNSRSPGSAKR